MASAIGQTVGKEIGEEVGKNVGKQVARLLAAQAAATIAPDVSRLAAHSSKVLVDKTAKEIEKSGVKLADYRYNKEMENINKDNAPIKKLNKDEPQFDIIIGSQEDNTDINNYLIDKTPAGINSYTVLLIVICIFLLSVGFNLIGGYNTNIITYLSGGSVLLFLILNYFNLF